jgi:hypothetical protein
MIGVDGIATNPISGDTQSSTGHNQDSPKSSKKVVKSVATHLRDGTSVLPSPRSTEPFRVSLRGSGFPNPFHDNAA